MESLNFNNQSKQESLNKEKNPETKVLSFDGLNFEYKETYTEFPEYLIKETGGVKGYIRKQFDSMEDIKEKIKEVYKDTSLEEMEDFFVKTNRRSEMFEGGYRGDYSKKKNIDDIRGQFIYLKTAKSINELYDLVTNNEFPKNTSLNFIHTGYTKSTSETTMRHFKEDGLFLQKIFGENRMALKSNSGRGMEMFFMNNGDNTIEQELHEEMPEYYQLLQKKEGGQEGLELKKFFIEKPSKRDFIENEQLKEKFTEKSLSDVNEQLEFFDSFLNQVKDPKGNLSLFMLGVAGLHCQNKDASGEDGLGWGSPTRINDNIFSGFSIKNKAFKEYLEKVKILLENLPEKTKEKMPSQINVSLKTVNYFLYNEDHVYSEHLEHPAIPIVQGYPNIPDLRWCHASYMSIPTKNGLNILEFIT